MIPLLGLYSSKGFPSTLIYTLHKKKLDTMEESFTKPYKYASFDKAMVVMTSKIVATANLEKKKPLDG